MRKEQALVKEFMMKAGQCCPGYPYIPDNKTRSLRVDLIEEELAELSHALHGNDIVGTADAIADLLVVVLGTAVACGIDIQPIWDEIYRSNMTKFIDGHMRVDGKWMKGLSYSPANLAPILEAQKDMNELPSST